MIVLLKRDLKYFEPLYNKYFESIFRFIYRKIGDEAIVADVTSKVFFNAMKALPKYENRNVPFGAWLYRIASNESNKHFQTTKKQQLMANLMCFQIRLKVIQILLLVIK